MALDGTARRRWFGAVVLFAALVMLVAGETALKGRLGDVAFIIYWLACFGLTSVAIVVAFLDVRAVRGRIREEQRKLLEATLKRIETEAKTKPDRSDPLN